MVFKPGTMAAAKGQLCYNILKIINCKSIKPTKVAEVPQLVSGKDLETTYVKLVRLDESQLLVNEDLLYPCKEKQYGDRCQLTIRGKQYELTSKDASGSLYLDFYSPTIKPFLEKPFTQLEDSYGSQFLAPQSMVYKIAVNRAGIEFIKIDGIAYKIIQEKSGLISLENAKTKENLLADLL